MYGMLMSEPRELSPRQQEVLEYIQEATDEDRRPPTVREMCGRLKVSSPGTVHDHLAAIEKAGWIERSRGQARSIRLLRRLNPKPVSEQVVVPLLGRIAAGHAVAVVESSEGHIGVDRSLLAGVRGGALFALRVAGDSMTGRGICEGDIAVAEADTPPRAGDVVVALVDRESTLKTMAQGPDGFFLKAENPRYRDLVPVTEMAIQGVVRVLIRKVE
jgi:repressor LexA